MVRRSLLSFAVLFCLPLAASAAEKLLPPKEAKAAFLKLLDRPRVDADAKLEPATEENGLVVQKLSIATEKKVDGTVERLPLLMVRPKGTTGESKPLPVMIVCHGTGGTKDKMRQWLDPFAKNGIIAIAIDARYHGERAGGKTGSAAYVEAITKAWKTPEGKPHEHPWFYDTCYDLWRLLDYLETRKDVDAKRIGLLGISMGGIQTYLAGSVDERIAVAAPLIGIQSFAYGLDNDLWQARANTVSGAHKQAAKDIGEAEVNQKVCRALWGKLIPGITSDFDCPNLLPLFAGRPLFIGNGELDPNCPIKGAELAFSAVRAAYTQAKAEDRLEIRVEKGVPHKVTPETEAAAIAFCVKWLKK